VGRQRDRERGVDPGDLLDRDAVGERVEAGAAPLLGVGQAEEAKLGHLAHEFRGELLLLVALGGPGQDSLEGELARGLANGKVLLAQQLL
jgi:hypothetical protein